MGRLWFVIGGKNLRRGFCGMKLRWIKRGTHWDPLGFLMRFLALVLLLLEAAGGTDLPGCR